jgi:hypothetical protein
VLVQEVGGFAVASAVPAGGQSKSMSIGHAGSIRSVGSLS